FTGRPPTDPSPLSLHDALPIYRIEDATGKAVWQAAPRMVCTQCEQGEPSAAGAALRISDTTHGEPAPLPEAQVAPRVISAQNARSEEHTSELQSPYDLVCRLLL